ncbi:MAG: hypothetical protein H0T79_06715 [Deltaproteobacteria bacterium]|nr:hypothetical protein [Deltaproteobacteria bacterium]
MSKRTPIGMARPRLDRRKAWGYWHPTLDGTTLVFDRPESGNYQVTLADLRTLEEATLRIAEVAAKDAWVDQRVIDDLCRAVRELTKLPVPKVLVPRVTW